MERYGYIYLTTNLINGKIYVGQHAKCEFDEKYKGSGSAIRSAFRKYGWNNFSCEIICWCSSPEMLDKMEQYWIRTFKSHLREIGYNLCLGGQGIHGYRHTSSTKQKISKNNARFWKGRPLHPNTIAGSILALKGKPSPKKGAKLPEHIKVKVSIGLKKYYSCHESKNIGIHPSEESRRKMSISHLGKPSNRKGCHLSVYTRKQISEKLIEYYKNNPCKGHGFTEEAKRQISQSVTIANTGKRFINNGEINKYCSRELAEELVLQGWVYGKLLKGKDFDRITLMSELNKGRKWVNNGFKQHFIKAEELEEYLSKGFYLGQLTNTIHFHSEETKAIIGLNTKLNQTGRIGIVKDGKQKKIKPEELDYWLSLGWVKGGLSRKHTPEEKEHLRKTSTEKCANRGKIAIHKNNNLQYIFETDLEKYLSTGWIKGGLPSEKKGKSYKKITNGIINMTINPEELEKYIAEGWRVGMVRKQ